MLSRLCTAPMHPTSPGAPLPSRELLPARRALIGITVLLAVLSAGLVAAPASAQDARRTPAPQADEGATRTVRLARATWDTGWFQAEIYRLLLQELGFRVEGPATMENAEFYAAVDGGGVDLWANGWFPLHGSLLGTNTEVVGTQVDAGALQGYFMDLPTAEAYGVDNLGDLADPEVAAAFDHDGDGRAELVGCNLEWACADVIAHHLEVYELSGTVEHVQGDYSPLMGETVERASAGEPVLYYGFTPHWAPGELVPGVDVRWLETPFPSLPDDQADAVDRTEVSDVGGCVGDPCQTGWPPNDIRAVANADFLADHEAVRVLLQQVHIPLDDILEQNARMVAGEGDIADIRRHAEDWIAANQADVRRWLDEADPDATPFDDPARDTRASTDTLRMAVRTLEPFVRYENGTYDGFSVELMDLIAARLGADTDIYGVDTVAKQLDDVRRGEADVAVAAIGITSDRERAIDFTVPVFDTGLTILVPTEQDQGPLAQSGRVLRAVLASELPWMLLFFAGVLLLASHVIWWAERRRNPDDFRAPYRRGLWDAFWWSSVTITTVGYGDKTPKGNTGRAVALVWMFAGYFVFASFTASITSTLAVDELRGSINGPADLRQHRVATVEDSAAERYLRTEGIGPATFAEIEGAYTALLDGEVEAIVYDAPVLQYHASHDGSGEVRTVGPVFDRVRYGVAVDIDDRDLRKRINVAMLELMESGVYDDVHNRWFGELN